MPKMYKIDSSGFTLVELLVVIGIIIILSTVGLSIYKQADVQSRDNQRQASLKQVQAALEQYHNDLGYYPDTASVKFDTGGQIAATVHNPVTNSDSNNVYLNILPRDPQYTGGSSTHKDYKYIPRPNHTQLPLTDAVDCDNSVGSANKCLDYCLIAQLEVAPSSLDSTCITSANPLYNYSVRKGRN